jgi:hypothetical protein
MMARAGWRAIVATWGGAAFLLLRQFGVPAPSSTVTRETRIVQVVEAGDQLAAGERIQDERILTVPLEPRLGEPPHFCRRASRIRFSAN